MESRLFSVTELNNRIKSLLEGDAALSAVFVSGELSNYKIYPSGHHYFTLKDAECSLRCVMFRGAASRLAFRPQNGMEAVALGHVSVYPRDGQYQLYCEMLRPLGRGDLQLRFERLRARLDEEGLFAQEHKKPLPQFPKRIAVVTSGAGAAVHDIIRVTGSRWPMAKIIVLPVRVQGEEAPAEIAEAIRYADALNLADVIITGRGGGSMEELWAFNDERVVRAVYDSETPVISAVGHEPDVTITDYAADRRAATPSNGAEIAVPDASEIRRSLENAERTCIRLLERSVASYRSRLEALRGSGALRRPLDYVDGKRLELDRISDRLTAAGERRIAALRAEVARNAAKADALSPLRVLARGYAIVSGGDGEIIRSAGAVSEGDSINVRLSDGSILCRAENVNTEVKNGRKN